MDGPHDLGGKEGFGPVDVDAPEFREEWERRQWALSKNLPTVRSATIDWWRHGVEQMHPVAYLSEPYFSKWNLNDLAQGVDAGVFTLDEVVAGASRESKSPPPVKTVDELKEQLRSENRRFSGKTREGPKFNVGDQVVTQRIPSEGHTRLPAYARAARGVIIACHGGHLFPDAGALGRHEYQHLYTVEFSSTELWGRGVDSVCIDLWESYLEAT